MELSSKKAHLNFSLLLTVMKLGSCNKQYLFLIACQLGRTGTKHPYIRCLMRACFFIYTYHFLAVSAHNKGEEWTLGTLP